MTISDLTNWRWYIIKHYLFDGSALINKANIPSQFDSIVACAQTLEKAAIRQLYCTWKKRLAVTCLFAPFTGFLRIDRGRLTWPLYHWRWSLAEKLMDGQWAGAMAMMMGLGGHLDRWNCPFLTSSFLGTSHRLIDTGIGSQVTSDASPNLHCWLDLNFVGNMYA